MKFASRYYHDKLYNAYDKEPDIWKPALYSYFCSGITNWKPDATEEEIEEYREKGKERRLARIESAVTPFDTESCDYWCERRINKAVQYTKHASCRWMSFVNYYFAQKYMFNQSWFHVADDEMNHYYVINDKMEILDPQGLALQFEIHTYEKTFTPDKVSSLLDVIDSLEWHQYDYLTDKGEDDEGIDFYELLPEFYFDYKCI